MPQQLLYGPDVVAIFQHMGGNGMAQGVRAGWLRGMPTLSGALLLYWRSAFTR